jgi:hypothetical protein
MWIPPHTTVPPGAHGAQRERHERAVGREDDRGVQRLGRGVAGRSGPRRAELTGEALRRLVAGPGERVDPPALPDGDLGHDVRGRAEAVEAQPPCLAAQAQGAEADQPRAQQRGDLHVGVVSRDGEAEALVGHRVLGEAAVDVASGESRARAEVLPAAAAVLALAAGPAQPWDAHPPPAGHGRAHDLMPEDPRRLGHVDLAVQQVQVRPADAAGQHLEQELPRPGDGHRPLDRAQRPAGRLEHHRAHPVGGHDPSMTR